MFCMQCGWENPDGARFCNHCGTALTTATADSTWTADVAADDLPPLNDINELAGEDNVSITPTQEQHKNKRSAPAPVWIVAFGILLASLIVFVLMFPTVSAFLKRSFTSPDKLLSHVYCSSAENLFSQMEAQSDRTVTDNKSFQADVHLVSGDRMMDLLSGALSANVDSIHGLSDIGVQADVSIENNLLKAVYTVALGNADILTAQQYVDSENKEMWLTFPQLQEQALYIDFSRQPESDILPALQLDSEKLESVTLKYLQMYLSGLQNVEKTKKTVKLQELTQKMTVLEATISHRALDELLIQMLSALKEDPDALELYTQLSSGNQDGWIQLLDNSIAVLQAELDDMDTDNTYISRTYLNKRNDIVGVSLFYVEGNRQAEALSYITVLDGRRAAQKFVFDNDLVVVGSCTAEKKLSGNYTMYYKNEEICSAELKNCVYKGDNRSGSLQIVPTNQAVKDILKAMELNSALVDTGDFMDFAVNICWESSDSGISYNVSLLAEKSMLFGITIDAAEKQPEHIQLPRNYVDAGNEEQFQQWIAQIPISSLDEIFNRIKQAGFPDLSLPDGENPLQAK